MKVRGQNLQTERNSNSMQYLTNPQKTRILIVAGGGAFGIIPSYFFSNAGITSITDLVSVLGGTSVGSELICAYGAGVDPQEVYKKFLEALPELFKQSFWPTIRGPKYDTVVLQRILKDLIPGKFGDIKIPVVIPVMDFKYNKFKVYDNIIKDVDCDLEAYQPPTQSSSAPTYFAPYMDCVDGGIVENIPIMTTIFAVRHKMGIDFKDMNVLVVGTGHKNIKPRNMKEVAKWYVWQWLKPMLGELTDANEKASVFWAKLLGLNHFSYFNPVELEKDWEMDKPQAYINELPKRCDKHVDEFKKAFKEFLIA